MDRQNVAYDLSMYEALLEPKAKKEPKPEQAKVVKIKNKRALKNVVNVMSIAVILSLIIGVIWTNAEITKTTTGIAAAQNAIIEAESEKTYLEFTLESRMSLNEIEDYAVGVLGMVKMDSSQIEYVEIETENKVEWGEASFTDKIEDVVQPILSYFQP